MGRAHPQTVVVVVDVVVVTVSAARFISQPRHRKVAGSLYDKTSEVLKTSEVYLKNFF